jgi:hypothetical protein
MTGTPRQELPPQKTVSPGDWRAPPESLRELAETCRGFSTMPQGSVGVRIDPSLLVTRELDR